MIKTLQALLWNTLQFLLLTFFTVVISHKLPADAGSAAATAFNYLKDKQFTQARDIASEALKRYPNDTQLWNILGISETESGAPLRARHAFSRGLGLSPNSISLNENMGLLYFRQADYSSAEKYLARAVELGSKQPGVRFSLAASRLRTGAPAKALTELKALETDLSSVPGYWEERGRAESIQDPAKAEESFEQALRLDPASAVGLNGAAEAAERQGLDEKALNYLIRARTAHPDDVDTLIHFGSVCIRRDLGPDAREALEHAHQLQPTNSSALYLLARANVALQNWRLAYDLFHEFAQRQPEFAPAYYAMGWLALRLNHTEEARRLLEHCLKLEPALVDARVDLAQLELDDGRADRAEQLLRAALTTEPEHAGANVAMAGILQRRNEFGEAERCLRKAIARDPSLAAAHYRLANVLQREHQPDEAQRELAVAAKLNTETREASKTQLKLVLPEPIQ